MIFEIFVEIIDISSSNSKGNIRWPKRKERMLTSSSYLNFKASWWRKLRCCVEKLEVMQIGRIGHADLLRPGSKDTQTYVNIRKNPVLIVHIVHRCWCFSIKLEQQNARSRKIFTFKLNVSLKSINWHLGSSLNIGFIVFCGGFYYTPQLF